MDAIDLPLLWHVYKRLGINSLRDGLLRAYLPWTRKVATRVARNLPMCVEVDDLVSNGVVGLIDAIESYDPARGKTFEQYALRRVHGAMMDGLREIDPADRHTRTLIKRLEQLGDTIRATRGRPATSEELRDQLGLSSKRMRSLERRRSALQSRSLSGDRHSTDDSCAINPQTLADPRADDPVRVTMSRNLRDSITRDLEPAERLIVLLYYCEEMTMREIGTVLDLSESRICQLHTNVMNRLRARLHPRLLAG